MCGVCVCVCMCVCVFKEGLLRIFSLVAGIVLIHMLFQISEH